MDFDFAVSEKQVENYDEPPTDLFGDHAYLLKYWKELSPAQRLQLLEQYTSINIKAAKEAFQNYVTEQCSKSLLPIPAERHILSQNLSREELELYWNKGLELIAQGKVAALVVAGGQATRLGVSIPKGICPLYLTKNCNTLFDIQAFRLARLQKLARQRYPDRKCILPWYVMTSAHTNKDISKYLEKNVKQYGLLMDNIHTFTQGQMPCFDFNGKFILSDKGMIAMSPNGNGGMYEALRPLLKTMRDQGIQYVHVYGVDNVLCRVADPHFIGFCALKDADCAAKVVEKKDPDEAVGLICQENGLVKLAEYSEISEDLKVERMPSGRLKFCAGNIASHFFSLNFLERVSDCNLPYHRALKKIPFYDGEKVVEPSSVNGIKSEMFMTDSFQYSQNFYLWEVDRSKEFSPWKNSEIVGKDCCSTCLRDLFEEHKRWLRSSDAEIVGNSAVFIHPLKSYLGEGLEEYAGQKIQTPHVFGCHK